MKKRLLSLIRIPAFCVFLFSALSAAAQTTTSILSSGQFFKVAVNQPGIYKLDANFLSNSAGINLGKTAANRITLWTNGGGTLPRLADAPRIDDLREVKMFGVGMEDGKVDAGDYFLFYAEGPSTWSYDPDADRFRFTKNIYDTRNYYFIGVTGTSAGQIEERQAGSGGEIIITASDFYANLEEDKLNLLGRYRPPGSGQKWHSREVDHGICRQKRRDHRSFSNLQW